MLAEHVLLRVRTCKANHVATARKQQDLYVACMHTRGYVCMRALALGIYGYVERQGVDARGHKSLSSIGQY